jgi:hypothetical protein
MTNTVDIRVELFGMPRLRVGRREVGLRLPSGASTPQLVAALAQVCPQLVGHALREDCSGLQEGYVFNRNGLAFLDQGAGVGLQSGDSLLLLSSQSGG